ncbi:thioredoxin domain-containing protein [Streptomyces pactum]|uniref:Thioredoxin domain-containing protein n=1 Tax=Streptomyces pactum TaxID=68249 RepID=A0ABS0NIW4_9ACTN|nr:thioredoxin domain-containing protein [Streptomyces pactum]MBH5335088.1 thioredoxin domain-containing protein [Streptomyces pactum]MBH5338831.1 thioredoxin domain-containing protein [Streptomyces pactum]
MPAPSTTRRLAATGAVIAFVVAVFLTVLALGDDGGGVRDHGPAGDRPEVSAEQRRYDELTGRSARRTEGDPMAVGRADAPVVLVEYADYQCSYCGEFARTTRPELVERYVERGLLRIEFRNFPIFGADSERAARASWAAGRQGRFWEFHDELFAHPRKGDALAEDRLVELARRGGVPDLDRFRRDLNGEAAGAALERDREQGYRLGVQSTPSFLVNGRPVAGAQPVSVFAEVIDDAAAAARHGGADGTEGADGADGARRPDGGTGGDEPGGR